MLKIKNFIFISAPTPTAVLRTPLPPLQPTPRNNQNAPTNTPNERNSKKKVFAAFVLSFGQIAFWMQLLSAVGLPVKPPAVPVLKLADMFGCMEKMDSFKKTTRRLILTKLFSTSFYDHFVREKNYAMLMVVLDYMNGTGTQMIDTIKRHFQPVVDSVLPSQRQTQKARDILRVQFLEEFKLISLPRGMRVNLVSMVGIL